MINFEDFKESRGYPFARRLMAVPIFEDEKLMYEIRSIAGRLICKTDELPLKSYQDSGAFKCLVNGGKNVRYMDGDGLFCFGIYGKRSRSFYNKRALVERKDGTLTFLTEKGKELNLQLEWATDFIYAGPSAQVIFADDEDKKIVYISTSGRRIRPPVEEVELPAEL